MSPVGFVHELAIAVMDEVGIDIRGHESKGLAEALTGHSRAPLLVILCEYAAKRLECLPGAVRKLHWPVDDPVETQGSLEHCLGAFRKIRDEIGKLLIEAVKNGVLQD